jgi:hypothetical protein
VNIPARIDVDGRGKLLAEWGVRPGRLRAVAMIEIARGRRRAGCSRTPTAREFARLISVAFRLFGKLSKTCQHRVQPLN